MRSRIRQVTHVSIGGSQLRVQFSNLFGNGSVTIKSAHLAICKATPLVDSTIDTATDTALAFSGTETVTIAQGKEIWSDPVAFTVPPLGNVTITTAFGTVPSQVTGHSGSRTNSFIQAGGSTVNAASMTSATSVLDFDAAVTDGSNPPKLQWAYATWTSADGSGDGLHPSPAGYQKMADSADLSLFTK